MMLKDKVAVITGAGRGIGREVALLLAREGAKVVVNDLGGKEDGTGGSQGPSDEVVKTIQEAGGQAVSSYESVAAMDGAEAMIQTALDNFGKIDILHNVAGILRDRIFHKMSEEDWDAVLTVHLKGHFNMCRAAAPHFRKQEHGKIINYTSTSGLIGNRGQTNYGAAKLGIVALSRNLALDMARFNVTVNCISPFAWTRLIGTIPTDTPEQKTRVEKLKKMTAADIAPLAVFLSSDRAANINGQIFGVRGKEVMIFSLPRPVRSIADAEGWTPEKIADRYDGTLKHAEVPLVTSAEYFSYDPVV